MDGSNELNVMDFGHEANEICMHIIEVLPVLLLLSLLLFITFSYFNRIALKSSC